jgi:hypothetical protein
MEEEKCKRLQILYSIHIYHTRYTNNNKICVKLNIGYDINVE